MGTNLDLDNLVPEAAQVKIGGENLTVNPPTLRTLFVINRLATEIQGGDATVEQMEAFQTDLKAELNKLCPGLEKHDLNGAQILALSNLIAEMAQPERAKTNTAAGSEAASDPKEAAA